MADEGFKRKLTAILSADVKGYSRMMRDDEDSTIRTLTNYRSAISNLIQYQRGGCCELCSRDSTRACRTKCRAV